MLDAQQRETLRHRLAKATAKEPYSIAEALTEVFQQNAQALLNEGVLVQPTADFDKHPASARKLVKDGSGCYSAEAYRENYSKLQARLPKATGLFADILPSNRTLLVIDIDYQGEDAQVLQDALGLGDCDFLTSRSGGRHIYIHCPKGYDHTDAERLKSLGAAKELVGTELPSDFVADKQLDLRHGLVPGSGIMLSGSWARKDRTGDAQRYGDKSELLYSYDPSTWNTVSPAEFTKVIDRIWQLTGMAQQEVASGQATPQKELTEAYRKQVAAIAEALQVNLEMLRYQTKDDWSGKTDSFADHYSGLLSSKVYLIQRELDGEMTPKWSHLVEQLELAVRKSENAGAISKLTGGEDCFLSKLERRMYAKARGWNRANQENYIANLNAKFCMSADKRDALHFIAEETKRMIGGAFGVKNVLCSDSGEHVPHLVFLAERYLPEVEGETPLFLKGDLLDHEGVMHIGKTPKRANDPQRWQELFDTGTASPVFKGIEDTAKAEAVMHWKSLITDKAGVMMHPDASDKKFAPEYRNAFGWYFSHLFTVGGSSVTDSGDKLREQLKDAQVRLSASASSNVFQEVLLDYTAGVASGARKHNHREWTAALVKGVETLDWAIAPSMPSKSELIEGTYGDAYLYVPKRQWDSLKDSCNHETFMAVQDGTAKDAKGKELVYGKKGRPQWILLDLQSDAIVGFMNQEAA